MSGHQNLTVAIILATIRKAKRLGAQKGVSVGRLVADLIEEWVFKMNITRSPPIRPLRIWTMASPSAERLSHLERSGVRDRQGEYLFGR